MDKIIEKFNIKRSVAGKLCLNDIVANIIESSNGDRYIDNVKAKKKIGHNYYIDTNVAETMILRGMSAKCKECKKILQSKDTIVNVVNAGTIIDITNNILTYDNISINTIFDEEHWFKGKDIATILGYSNTKDALTYHVHVDDKKKFSAFNSIKNSGEGVESRYPFSGEINQPETIYINESGLYSLIMSSKKKEAKVFQRWVTKEVLPSIRKTGSYTMTDTIKMLPDIVHKANEDIDTNWVYILKLKNNMYKFGITLHLRKRLQTHNREKHPDGIIKLYPLPTYNMCMSVEGKIKEFTKKIGINLFKEKTHEYFKSTDKYPEEDIITIIGQIVNEEIITENKNSEIQKLKVQNDLLRSLVLTKFPLQDNNNLIDNSAEEKPKKLIKSNRKTDHCTCDSVQRRDENICIYCTGRNKVLESIKNGRPTYKNLKDELKQTSYTKMSIKYKVSPTTIKKWIRMCEKYKLT